MPQSKAGSNAAPIIIKRKKVVAASGHHGGAWKVAYADFVTAMMAFFMLMWLLNATTEKQRKGLADYFAPTVSISRVSGGGTGNMQGDTVFAQDALPQTGIGGTSARPAAWRAQDPAVEQGRAIEPDDALARIEEAILARVVESAEGNAIMPHIATRITEDGLVLTLRDLPGVPLFGAEAEITPTLSELLDLIAGIAALVENQLAIDSHVRRFPIVMAEDPAWRLTEARAGAVHRALEDAGLPPRRIRRVTAHADRDAEKGAETHPRNNRVEITFLR